ncbi:hypothetical protein BFP78_03240 [Gaetbulibacter sp. 5U11]|nr:hypothetical protein BFP78_03240 [Gaetbulibacter sp. 5U11]
MKLFKPTFIAIITLFIFSCNEKETKKAVFQPNPETGKDVVISEGYPTNNYSNLDKLHLLSLSIRDTIDNDSRFMIRFGFSSIPEESVIDSAFIYLSAIEPGHFGENNGFLVERLTNVWINDEANWQNQPNSHSASAIKVDAPKNKLQDYKIDVTSFVSDVVNKKYKNFGHLFKLQSEEKPHKGIRFYSSNTENESKRPKLEVYYKEK